MIGNVKTIKRRFHTQCFWNQKREDIDHELLEGQFKTKKQTIKPKKAHWTKLKFITGYYTPLQPSLMIPWPMLTWSFTAEAGIWIALCTVYGLIDGNDNVCRDAYNTLCDIVTSNGDSEEAIAFLLPLFETILSSGVADESCLGPMQLDLWFASGYWP
jgi:hypothetical protein